MVDEINLCPPWTPSPVIQVIQMVLFDCLKYFAPHIYYIIDWMIEFKYIVFYVLYYCNVVHQINAFLFLYSIQVCFFRNGLLQVFFFVLLTVNPISMGIVSLLLRTFN